MVRLHLVLYLKRLAIRANLLRLVSQGVQACLASQEDQVIRKTQAHHHHQALPLLQARQTNLVHCHPQVFHRLIFSLLTFPLLASLLLALHLRAFHLQAFHLRAKVAVSIVVPRLRVLRRLDAVVADEYGQPEIGTQQ